MKIMRYFKLLFICLLLFHITLASAQESTCKASLDKNKIRVNEAAILSIICFEAEGMPAPQLPAIDGFDLRYLNSLNVTLKRGYIAVKAIKHRYTLTARAEGNFTIEAMDFVFDGKSFNTQPLIIEVLPVSPQELKQEAQEKEPKISLPDERAFVILEAEKTDIYLSQRIKIAVKLYVNRKNISLSDVQYPTLQQSNFSMGEFSKPQRREKAIDGNYYEVLVFENTIFPIKIGSFKLGPAKIRCQLLSKRKKTTLGTSGAISDSEYEWIKSPAEFTSSAVTINALDFPSEGQPENFSKAIGDFLFDAEIDTKELEVGAVATLTMKIAGVGNLDMVGAPNVTADGFKIYQPEVEVKKDAKVFKQILIPEKSGSLTINKINFSFFDPETKEYQQITKGPFWLNVYQPKQPSSGHRKAAGAISQEPYALEEDLGRDIVYIKDSPGTIKRKGVYFFNSNLFKIIQLFPAFIFLGLFLVNKRIKHLKMDEKYARYITAAKRAKKDLGKAKKILRPDKSKEFCAVIFAIMQRYLGDKFSIPAGGITINDIEEISKTASLNKKITASLKEFFIDYDKAVFLPDEINKKHMTKLFKAALGIIKAIEKQKIARAKKPAIFLMILAALLLYTQAAFSEQVHQQIRDESFVHEVFFKGNSFYQQEKFKEAISQYEKIIDAGLESASVYYNLANSYFKTGFVGNAILNYERARRLNPGDSDILTNLEHANSLIVDRSIQMANPWFVDLIKSIPQNISANQLCFWLFTINILIFTMLAINLFLRGPSKLLVFIVAILIVSFVSGFAILGKKTSSINNKEEAIVVVKELDCRFGPLDNATVYFKLYEGSKIKVLKSEGTWSKVRRFDGKIGWLKKDSYETI